MSKSRAVKDILRELKQDLSNADGGIRRLTGQTLPERLIAIVHEVEDTILPRSVAFRSDGAELVLDAGNRRVYGVTRVTPETLWSSEEPMFEVRHENVQDQQLDALMACFEGFANSVQDIQVMTGPVSRPRDADELGFSAGELRLAIDNRGSVSAKAEEHAVSASVEQNTGRLQAFYQASAKYAQGRLHLKGDGVAGVDAALPASSWLEKMVQDGGDAFATYRTKLNNSVGQPDLVILSSSSGNALSIAMVTEDDQAVLIAHGRADTAQLFSLWRSVATG